MGAPGERIYAKGTIWLKAKLMNGKQTKTKYELEPRDAWSRPMLINKQFIISQAKFIQRHILRQAAPAINLRYFRNIATMRLVDKNPALRSNFESTPNLPIDLWHKINEYLFGKDLQKDYLLDVDQFLADIKDIYNKHPNYYKDELEFMNSFTKEDIESLKHMVTTMVNNTIFSPNAPSLLQEISDDLGITALKAYVTKSSAGKMLLSNSWFKANPKYQEAPIVTRLFAFNNFLRANGFCLNENENHGVSKESKNADGKTAEELALQTNNVHVLKSLGIKNTWGNTLKNALALCPNRLKLKSS